MIFGVVPAPAGDRRRPHAHLGVVGGPEVQQLGERVSGRVGDALGRGRIRVPHAGLDHEPVARNHGRAGGDRHGGDVGGVSRDLLDKRRRGAGSRGHRRRGRRFRAGPDRVGGRHRERIGGSVGEAADRGLRRRVRSVDGDRSLRRRPDVRGDRVAGDRTAAVVGGGPRHLRAAAVRGRRHIARGVGHGDRGPHVDERCDRRDPVGVDQEQHVVAGGRVAAGGRRLDRKRPVSLGEAERHEVLIHVALMRVRAERHQVDRADR